MFSAAWLDSGVESIFHLGKYLPTLNPLGGGLEREREKLALSLAERARPRLAPLQAEVALGDPGATEAFDRIVAEVIGEMRQARPEGLSGWLAGLDRLLYHNGEELLDNPSFPEAQRTHLLSVIDRLNIHLGSYQAWGQLLDGMEAFRRRGVGPLRLHDLAAGHGGFAIWLKERDGDRVDLTASDLKEEYLDLGREEARRRGVAVRFVKQDATDLSGLDDSVDLFLCTQSLHHFPPGMVARMIGQAARHARFGLCFIDAERGFVPLVLLGPLMGLYGRTYAAVHDTVVSLRRMYYAEELLLLARLAPGLPDGAVVQAGRRRPGYAYLAVTRP